MLAEISVIVVRSPVIVTDYLHIPNHNTVFYPFHQVKLFLYSLIYFLPDIRVIPSFIFGILFSIFSKGEKLAFHM